LSNALRAQKNDEDESYQIALVNLRTEVIRLRNEALEKDKILLSLVDRIKASEAKLTAQSEAHKTKVEDLKKKLAEKNEDFEVAKAKQEISEWTSSRLQKNVDELRESKERYYKKSLDCAKKLKDSFAKVGANLSEQKFIRGDPEGIIEWIGEEAEAFNEILSDHGDFYAFAGARGIATILVKNGCDHVKAAAQAETVFSIEDTKEPSAEATLMGGKFYSNVWMKGGHKIADEAIKKNEKESHDAREEAKRAEEVAKRTRRIGIITEFQLWCLFFGFGLTCFFI
jgi:hypothetical protein